MKLNIVNTTKTLFITAILLLIFNYAYSAGWTPRPSGTPGSNTNITPLVNTGPDNQIINGDLKLNSVSATSRIQSMRDFISSDKITGSTGFSYNYTGLGLGPSRVSIGGGLNGGSLFYPVRLFGDLKVNSVANENNSATLILNTLSFIPSYTNERRQLCVDQSGTIYICNLPNPTVNINFYIGSDKIDIFGFIPYSENTTIDEAGADFIWNTFSSSGTNILGCSAVSGTPDWTNNYSPTSYQNPNPAPRIADMVLTSNPGNIITYSIECSAEDQVTGNIYTGQENDVIEILTPNMYIVSVDDLPACQYRATLKLVNIDYSTPATGSQSSGSIPYNYISWSSDIGQLISSSDFQATFEFTQFPSSSQNANITATLERFNPVLNQNITRSIEYILYIPEEGTGGGTNC